MRAGPGAALSAILIAALAFTTSAAIGGETPLISPNADGGSSEVARALFDEAQAASGLGDWESAAACLDAAASQDPGDSDVLYLRALSSVKRGMPFATALGDLDAALGTDRFRSYSKREASILKAELLVRERRWKKALDALGSPGGGSAVDPAYSLVKARALLGAGSERAFLSELGEGLRRFPDDSSFARLFLASAARIPLAESSNALRAIVLGRLKRYSEADPELPVLAAPLMADPISRRDAVLAYRASGGQSPKASLRALEYGIIDEASASAELLAGKGLVADEDLSALLALAGSPAGKAAVLSALGSWTGIVLVDADSDGFYEGRFKLDRGLVREWSRDSRQEGRVDETAGFLDGMPREIRLERADQEIWVKYSEYPAVSAITFARAKGRVSYAFAPEAFAFAPLALSPVAGSGKDSIIVPRALDANDPSERAASSSALSAETISGDKREVVTLDRGLPVASVAYIGDRLLSTRSYEKGKPVLERVDADGDGRFETERGFAFERNARDAEGSWTIAWIRNDMDGDGVFEYREQTQFPFRKEWDYDGNGSVDASREELSDGSVKESYSSRLDGRLDEEITVRKGRIVSVARDGIRLDLIEDANRQLTWIGKKGFDIGSGLPDGEGIFSHDGKRYRLSRIGAFAFAELIP